MQVPELTANSTLPRPFRTAILAVLCLAGCGEEAEPECAHDAECPGRQICEQGACVGLDESDAGSSDSDDDDDDDEGNGADERPSATNADGGAEGEAATDASAVIRGPGASPSALDASSPTTNGDDGPDPAIGPEIQATGDDDLESDPTLLGEVGAPCVLPEDCASGVCVPEVDAAGAATGFPGGYCISDCTSPPYTCPSGSSCFLVDEAGTAACIAGCTEHADCREDYACFPDGPGGCFPDCNLPGGGCVAGYSCTPEGSCEADDEPLDCCDASDPCDWAGDGVCDCGGEATWDTADCEIADDCCDASDPCDWAGDGICDCNGETAWDAADCDTAEGAAVGEPCEVAADCASGICLPETDELGDTGWLGGYCLEDCTNPPYTCPLGSSCYLVGENGESVCLATCDDNLDCRNRYVCDPSDPGACIPACDTLADACASGTECDPSGLCTPSDSGAGGSGGQGGNAGAAGSGSTSGWICDPSFYDALDGCDCECGAWDPDCSIAGQTLFGCTSEQQCVKPGVCDG